MPDLTTKYLKLKLKNPIIVGSSGLTKSADKLKACEDAGAGAVVLKSLFEEALSQQDNGIDATAAFHTEVYEYLRAEIGMQHGPRDYCDIIEKAKRQVKIPVIASINCVSARWWPSFAQQIEAAGADALELNVFTTATDVSQDSAEIEKIYFDIIETVKAKIRIPVALKIGMYFTALPHFAVQLDRHGVDGLILFNRFTEPDIDIEKIKLQTTFSFSKKEDLHRPLRWIALLSGKVGCDLCATTGIQSGADVIKMLLAGASAVQLASVLYKNGLEVIPKMLSEIEDWMARHQFARPDDFIGKLNFKQTTAPDMYLRAQFMEKIRGVE